MLLLSQDSIVWFLFNRACYLALPVTHRHVQRTWPQTAATWTLIPEGNTWSGGLQTTMLSSPTSPIHDWSPTRPYLRFARVWGALPRCLGKSRTWSRSKQSPPRSPRGGDAPDIDQVAASPASHAENERAGKSDDGGHVGIHHLPHLHHVILRNARDAKCQTCVVDEKVHEAMALGQLGRQLCDPRNLLHVECDAAHLK